MNYFCTINGTELKLSVDEEGSRIRFVSSDRSDKVDIIRIGGGIFHLLLNARSHLITVNDTADGLRVSIDGINYQVKIEEEKSRIRGKHQLTNSPRKNLGRIYAPMAGLVVRINVAKGDTIEKEAPLLSLEAMKTENTIKSPIDGSVTSVNVTEGESIPVGSLLMVVE